MFILMIILLELCQVNLRETVVVAYLFKHAVLFKMFRDRTHTITSEILSNTRLI